MIPDWGKAILVAGVAVALLGHAALELAGSAVMVKAWTRMLFLGTVLVQIVALHQARRVRQRFDPDDRGRLTWTLITLFLLVRIVAELRLTTLYFGLVPGFLANSEAGMFVYKVGLRYLYTASDLLAIAALVSAIAAYRAVGLHFRLRPVDYAIALGVALVPAGSFVLRGNLDAFLHGEDPTIVTYRLVAVCVGAVVAGLSLVLLRYVAQMGGGALAAVWGAAALAGVARTFSFLVLALLSSRWLELAELAEQTLLWAFACGWLIAASSQRALLEEE